MDPIRVISIWASGFRQARLQAGWTAAPGGSCGAVLRGPARVSTMRGRQPGNMSRSIAPMRPAGSFGPRHRRLRSALRTELSHNF